MAMGLIDHGDGTYTFGDYTLSNKTPGGFTACYTDNNAIGDDGFWKSSFNPMVISVPVFTTQICIIIAINRLLNLILRYLHQPRFVCEMLSGIAVSPPILGITGLSNLVNPIKGNMILETMGNFALVFYVFLVGLEMDITSIKGIQKKAVRIAMAGVLPPLFIGFGLFYLMQKDHLDMIETSRERVAAMIDAIRGALFFGMSLSVTSFPDLARVLSDLKILHTDVGRLALSAGRVNDLSSWALFVLVLTIVNGKDKYYIILFTLIFLIFGWYGLRPVISWLIRRTSKDGKFSDLHFYFIITGVLVCALITDALGSQSLVGALMFGIIMPNEALRLQILNRFENFVSLILMPAFFMTSGIRTDLAFNFFFKDLNQILVAVIVIAMASIAKFISTFLVSYYDRMPARDAMAIGLLISTKGVVSLIIINAGRNLQRLTIEEFTTMAIAILIMTGAVKPIMLTFYNSSKRLKQNNNRTVEGSIPDSELRILACVHSNRNVTGIINLLDACNPTKKSPICVFAAHLLELTSRAVARLIVHDTDKNVGQFGHEKEGGESEQIISAFKTYKSNNEGAVFVQPLTVVSPFTTIHEDICGLAEDKGVRLILVPFHKLASTDGLLQEENSSIRSINQNLLVTARCSIGILVDRGFGSAMRSESVRRGSPHRRIAMIFIGGPDDREALAYAWRMAGYQCTELVVVRFVPTKDTAAPPTKDEVTVQDMKKLDDDYINEFRFRTMNKSNIKYVERQSNSGEETATTLRTMFDDCEMYIVGRGERSASPLTSGLSDWSDCAELGPIGDTIVSFAELSTVLVIQQRAPPVDKNSWRFGDRFT